MDSDGCRLTFGWRETTVNLDVPLHLKRWGRHNKDDGSKIKRSGSVTDMTERGEQGQGGGSMYGKVIDKCDWTGEKGKREERANIVIKENRRAMRTEKLMV